MSSTDTATTAPPVDAPVRRSRRRRAGLLAGIAIAAAVAVPGAALAAGTPGIADVTLKVGVFPAQGYDVELQAAGLNQTPYKVVSATFQSGGLITQSVAQGSVDLGPGSATANTLLAGATNSPRFLSVATIRLNTYTQDTIVPRGSKITSVAQLKGKKVAYIPNTTAQYFLLKQLQAAHLSWSDIKPVALDPSTAVSALLGGSVDAYAGFGNTILAALGQGAKVLSNGGGYLSGKYGALVGSENVNPASITNNAKAHAIADYIARVNTAFAWTRSHSEQWAAIVAKNTNQSASAVLSMFRAQERQVPSWVGPVQSGAVANEQAVADAFYHAGVIPNKVTSSRHYTTKLNALIAGYEAGYEKQYAAWFKTPSWAK